MENSISFLRAPKIPTRWTPRAGEILRVGIFSGFIFSHSFNFVFETFQNRDIFVNFDYFRLGFFKYDVMQVWLLYLFATCFVYEIKFFQNCAIFKICFCAFVDKGAG